MMAAASFAGPILSRVWQFHAFSPQTLDTLVAHSMRETAPKGAFILHEGAAGCDAFVVIEGRLEVQVAGKNGPLPVAVLTAGDLFGEVAIIEGTEVRTASVVALTPVTLLRIDGDTLREAIEDTPHTRAELSAAAHRMAVGRFIKSATLLGELAPEAVARLAQHVQERRVAAGETVIERGEPGEECFLIRTGELEVLDDNGEVTRRIATLRTGMLFGETALLTGAPRNATVRATADSDLLVLRRSDVLVALASQADVADHLVALMQARSRPRRRPGMEFHERPSADGNAIYTLKDPARGTYFRLSREGAFVWSHLDGHHTLRDLTMALFIEYKILAPDVVMDVVRRLAADGFVPPPPPPPPAPPSPPLPQRAVRGFVSFMEWSYTLKNCDAYFQEFYDRAGHYLNTRTAAIIAAIIAGGGFASFVAMAERSAGSLLHAATVWTVTLSMLPLIIAAIVLHEFGHGLAAKAAGARIDRVGIGWFWLRIILFVDTSDAWLATRRQRMLVDAAGILVNLVLAGIAGYVALLAPNKDVVAVAWVFALWSYVGVLRNLNPLLEYDGYFLLMDALERPNLRGKSLGWIATGLPVALRTRASLRGHRLELWYAFGAVVYIGIVTGWTLFAYRFTAQGWVARIFPPAWAPHIGHAFAFILGGLALFRLISDIRAERAKLHAHARHALHKG